MWNQVKESCIEKYSQKKLQSTNRTILEKQSYAWKCIAEFS